MLEISIWPLRKTWLSTCWKTLVGVHRGLVFLVVGHRFAHISGGVWSHSSLQILSESLRFWGWRLASRTFSSLHRLLWDWLGHSRTSSWATPLLPWPCVLGHCHAGIPIHDPFSMPWPWRYMAPSIVPLMRCSCPVLLAEKHPQSIMFPPPCLTVGMVFLGSFLLLQTRRVELMPKSWILVSSDHNTFTQFSSESLANFSTCAFLRFQSFTA